MTKTYSQIVQQIESLQQQADALRKKEVGEVIGRIKEAIGFYQLTADDLGLAFGVKAKPAEKTAAASKPAASGAQFQDDAGNSWSGRGPRPRWFKAALAAGKSAEDFRISGSSAAPGAAMPMAAPAKKAKPGKKKSAAIVKYRDDAGHTWSGRGPRPGWIKAGLAAGRPMESFAA